MRISHNDLLRHPACLSIPEDKRQKALNQLISIINKKKATIKEIQCLTGLLNFLNKAIIPGRAFTRRMYLKLKTTDGKGQELKRYHHTKIDKSFKMDCEIWIQFLKEAAENPRCLCKPFLDIDAFETSVNLQFFTNVLGSWA